MSSEGDDSTLSKVVLFIFVRAIYFIGCFFCLAVGAAFFLGGASRRGAAAASLLFLPEFWIAVTVLSIIGALVGPILYHRHTMRGRGSLKDIKEDGWYDGE